MTETTKLTLTDKLEKLLNGYENDSNTPDFILAEYLTDCLNAWNAAIRNRAAWYGRMDEPGRGSVPFPEPEPRERDLYKDGPVFLKSDLHT